MTKPVHWRTVAVAAAALTVLVACGGPNVPGSPSEASGTGNTKIGNTNAAGTGVSPEPETGTESTVTSDASNAADAPKTLEEAILLLEARGELPVLDRTDSIAGIDANGNGVRDDIEVYINKLPDTAQQKKDLMRFHRAITNDMLVKKQDMDQVREAMNGVTWAMDCIFKSYPLELSNERIVDVRNYTVNTKNRFIAHVEFAAAMDGSVIRGFKNVDCTN